MLYCIVGCLVVVNEFKAAAYSFKAVGVLNCEAAEMSVKSFGSEVPPPPLLPPLKHFPVTAHHL